VEWVGARDKAVLVLVLGASQALMRVITAGTTAGAAVVLLLVVHPLHLGRHQLLLPAHHHALHLAPLAAPRPCPPATTNQAVHQYCQAMQAHQQRMIGGNGETMGKKTVVAEGGRVEGVACRGGQEECGWLWPRLGCVRLV